MNNLGAHLFCQNLKENIMVFFTTFIKCYSLSLSIFKFKNTYHGHTVTPHKTLTQNIFGLEEWKQAISLWKDQDFHGCTVGG